MIVENLRFPWYLLIVYSYEHYIRVQHFRSKKFIVIRDVTVSGKVILFCNKQLVNLSNVWFLSSCYLVNYLPLKKLFSFLHIVWLSLTAFFSGLNFMVVSHDLHHVTQAGARLVGVVVQCLCLLVFIDGSPCACWWPLYFYSCASSLHGLGMFNLCSLTGDSGWWHDRFIQHYIGETVRPLGTQHIGKAWGRRGDLGL